ncbi:MAG: SRPBCC domain-containing protein [Gallionellaceae bacterium]|nr:MAG: SRPBCC domain-containing protein [Gallionellaceae bacterium]
MKSLHFSITIQAPKAQVHQLMLADKTYREWAAAFAEGSYYQGTWEKGAHILFTNADNGSGMSARIAEHRPAEFLSIEMLSMINDGVADESNPFQGVYENYSYTEKNGVTTLQVELLGVPDDWADYLNGTWPKALDTLKAICER